MAKPRKPAQVVTQRACDKGRKSPAPLPTERLKRIKRMMAEGEWRTGVSDLELAEEWGCDDSTVRRSSAEASRSLRNAIEDSGLAARLLTILLDNITNARRERRYEAVVRSCEAVAKIAGIDPLRIIAPIQDSDKQRPIEIRFVEAEAAPETAGG